MKIVEGLGRQLRSTKRILRDIKDAYDLRREESGCLNTHAVLVDADPKDWRRHLFGLSKERWDRLSERSFWITGAGTGYGRSIACALAASGATVFFTGRRVEKLKESLRETRELFGVDTKNCHLIPADLTNDEEIFTACERVRELCDNLYGMVHCAAVPSKPGSTHPLQNDTVSDWQRTIDTNVKAPWLLSRTILSHMLKGSEMRVLFITSEAGWADTAGFGIYNLSKAALNSLGHSMAREFAVSYPKSDIQINVISPAEARTEMNQGSTTSPYSLVSITLLLLSHPSGGPNGRFFHRDGRHLDFCFTQPYKQQLL